MSRLFFKVICHRNYDRDVIDKLNFFQFPSMRKQSHLNINEGFYSLNQLALSTSQTRLKEAQPELACNPIVNN